MICSQSELALVLHNMIEALWYTAVLDEEKWNLELSKYSRTAEREREREIQTTTVGRFEQEGSMALKKLGGSHAGRPNFVFSSFPASYSLFSDAAFAFSRIIRTMFVRYVSFLVRMR